MGAVVRVEEMKDAARVVARAVEEMQVVWVEAETVVATAVVATAEVRAVGRRRRWWRQRWRQRG